VKGIRLGAACPDSTAALPLDATAAINTHTNIQADCKSGGDFSDWHADVKKTTVITVQVK